MKTSQKIMRTDLQQNDQYSNTLKNGYYLKYIFKNSVNDTQKWTKDLNKYFTEQET